MEINKKDKFNVEKNGLFIGLIVPLLAISVIYVFINPESFTLFLKQAFLWGLYNKEIGLALIPNFVLYFYFRWKSKLRVSEGISIATLIYLLLFVILKYAT